MEGFRLQFRYEDFTIELFDVIPSNHPNSTNLPKYDFVYSDDESNEFNGSRHAISITDGDQNVKTALVIACGGSTGIHTESAVVYRDSLIICCANKVFSLTIPDLHLNWIVQGDPATCFGIYQAEDGLFVHGELRVTRLDYHGNTIWEQGLRDIIFYIDEDNICEDPFIMNENFISLLDFNGNRYQLGFDRKMLSEQLSEQQIRWDSILSNKREKQKKSWWRFWS